jgi:3-oxoacyl-[acyl-carrier protein] reductase
MMIHKDKIAIVTGSARGIGKAIAQKLAEHGCNLVISDILEEEAVNTAAEIASLGVNTLAIKTNIAELSDIKTLVEKTVEKFGTIDFLINNAGITRDNLAIRMSESEWDMVLDINLKGSFLCSQQVGKVMMKKRTGKIVNIASVSGLLGTAGQANYASSKAGLIALTKVLARELGARNINVNAVAPGFILTEMTEKLAEIVKEDYLSQIPLKRAGKPEDVADVVNFLVSPAANYVTGVVVSVSGGLVM